MQEYHARAQNDAIKAIGKEVGLSIFDGGTLLLFVGLKDQPGDITLAEKVQAILDHLGIEVVRGPRIVTRTKEVKD